MKKNDIFETEIMDMTTEGSGVCRVDNMAVFVPHTAVGDRIRVRIVKVLKSYAFGIVEELLEPSADRIVPACGLSQCGGCLFQHITYDAELRVKEKAVQDAFIRLGKLSPEFLPILGAESRTRYRNKAQYPFALDKTGQPILGFFARRSHRVISVKDCLLQPELFGKIAGTVLEFVRRNSISVYNESSGKGDMRHLYLRCGQHSGEVMVCFIVRKPIRKKLMPLVEILTEQYPQIKSISMNCNPKKTNVILGDSTETLWGKDTITDTMCGNAVDLSPESFYQVNTIQAERLYGAAKEFAQLTGKERLLDLYCGAGTIGLSMADAVLELVGVEIVPEAVENAKENAARAGVKNAAFFCGDAGSIAGKLAEQGVVGFDDGPAAPPVGGEDVDARFGRDGAQFRIGAHLVKERGVAAAPAVDGLFDVAHPCERTAARKGFQNKGMDGFPLFAAGILEFVHQDIGKPFAIVLKDMRLVKPQLVST